MIFNRNRDDDDGAVLAALTGNKRHLCPMWNMRPIDDTMEEIKTCQCPSQAESIKVKTTTIDIDTAEGAQKWAELRGVCAPSPMPVEPTSAAKDDVIDNKPDYSLIPKVLLDQLSYAMMAGAQKYDKFNYTKGHNITQLTAAATRHLKQIEAGEDIDKDISDRVGVDVHHAAAVCANMLMLLHQLELETLKDDRFKR